MTTTPRCRRLLHALPLVLFLAAPLWAAGTPPRNWGRCPATVDLQTTETFYALGDTHGDYDRLVALLAGGKLIAAVPASPDQVTWTGGQSILVVTGDMIDKWTQSLSVMLPVIWSAAGLPR